MKSPRPPAAALLVCLLLLMEGLGAAPLGLPEELPAPLGSEHKEPPAGGPEPGSEEAPDVRAPERQAEGELFQGVDPRALAAVLLQALDRPAPPPAAPRGPAEEAAEALLRGETAPGPRAPAGDPQAQELRTLAALLRQLRDFSPGGAEREPEPGAAAAETETRTHTLTRVDLESPGPERVWRASWGEFQARVPERSPLGEGASPPLAALGGPDDSEAGRVLRQGLAQVRAGRRRAEATRQAAAQEERLADLASDLLLEYLLRGGAGLREPAGPGPGAGQERRGGAGAGGAEQPREQEAERERQRPQEPRPEPDEPRQPQRQQEPQREEEDEEDDDPGAAEALAQAEEAERARQTSLLFADDVDADAGAAEDKRSQEEETADGEGGRGGGDDEDEEMDPQAIDSLIELSTRLHLPADDVVSIIHEVEEKRKRKKNAPPEPPRAAPRARSPPPPPPGPAQPPAWNEVLPPWDRDEGARGPPPNYIRARTPPGALPAARLRHLHRALGPPRGRLDPAAHERRLQELEERGNHVEPPRRP